MSKGGTKLISMTPLSAPELIVTFDLKDSPKDVRLNSVRQEGATENICGGNTFPVRHMCHIYFMQSVHFLFFQDSLAAECAAGNGCCDKVSGAGTKFVFDLSVDTNLANSFYIRTRGDKAMPDGIIVRTTFYYVRFYYFCI